MSAVEVLRSMLKQRLGWLQLKSQPARFAVALAGVAFASVLMLMQLGFRESLFESCVRFHRSLDYDIVLVGRETDFIVRTAPFTQRRLYQALGVAGVAAVSPVVLGLGRWENPIDHNVREIFVIGVDPARPGVGASGFAESRELIQLQDVVLYDRRSRPEFGPIAEQVDAQGRVATELNGRSVEVRGFFDLGTSFGIDGNVITSLENFRRIFPEHTSGLLNLGLIRLEPGAAILEARDAIRSLLPQDVLVLTRSEFMAREREYWDSSTPIGYVFAFGVMVGLVVGGIIVYQILFADVSDHLPDYATLKAIGYSDAHLTGVVLQQALVVSVLGFAPGIALSLWLYRIAGSATGLPLTMTPARAASVFLLMLGMCCVAALLAMRRVRTLDPAEVY